MKRAGSPLVPRFNEKRAKHDLKLMLKEAKIEAYFKDDCTPNLELEQEMKQLMKETKKRLKDPSYRLAIEKEIEEAKKKYLEKQRDPVKQNLVKVDEKSKNSVKLMSDHCGLGQNNMKILIKMLNGSASELGVASSDSITEVKAKIGAKMGIPSDLQHLIFEGKELEQSCKLRDCGIINGSELTLALTLQAAAGEDADIFVTLHENSDPNVVENVLSNAKALNMKIWIDVCGTQSLPSINNKVDNLKQVVIAQGITTDKKMKETYGVLSNRVAVVEEKIELLSISSSKKSKKSGKKANK